MPEITNPYEGLDWEDVTLHKSEFHNHTMRDFPDEPADVIDLYVGDRVDYRGEVMADGEEYTVFACADKGHQPTNWPWTELDQLTEHDKFDAGGPFDNRDPEALGVISFPACEITGVEHQQCIFSTIVNDNIEYETWQEAVAAICNDTAHGEPDSMVVIGHPAAYEDDGQAIADKYMQIFDEFSLEDGLLGIESLNKAVTPARGGVKQTTIEIEAWDILLTEFMPDRPIWAFGTDDARSSSEFWSYGYGLDVRYQLIALENGEFDPSDQEKSRAAAADAYRNGRTFAVERDHWHGDFASPPQPATINSITVDGDTITIDADEYDKIRWISRGITVGEGESLTVTGLHEPYVRAQIQTNHLTLILTQPFGVDGGEKQVVDGGTATIGDATY